MINYVEKYHHHMYYSIILSCFGMFILQRLDFFTLQIGRAVPILLVPAVIVIACFLREWTGFITGLCCGIALDTVTNGSYCFNTIALMLLGTAAGLIFRLFLNRNIKAIIIVGLLGSLIFFIFKWLFLDLFSGDASAVQILLRYHLPSAIYSAVFVIPFFYYVKWLCHKYLIQK